MCGSMKLMARKREHLPFVIDEPEPEDSIKFKATEDVILPKNLLKNSFQNVKKIELVHLMKMLKKMVLKKMLIKFLNENPLILALQMKCKSRRSSMTLKHQVHSHALFTFV